MSDGGPMTNRTTQPPAWPEVALVRDNASDPRSGLRGGYQVL